MAGKSLQPPHIWNPCVSGWYESRSVSLYKITTMKVDKISRYWIVARLQHGHQSLKYWVTISASIQHNNKCMEWIIVNIQAPCIGLIQKSVSFSLQYNRNESRQAFQVLDSCKIATWSAKTKVLGDHVRNYTIEQSVYGMDKLEHTKSRSISYMDNRNNNRRRDTQLIELLSWSPFESENWMYL